MKNIKYNPTCMVTGKTNDLEMYAHRNEAGDMIGWFFLNKDVSVNMLNMKFEFSYPEQSPQIKEDKP